MTTATPIFLDQQNVDEVGTPTSRREKREQAEQARRDVLAGGGVAAAIQTALDDEAEGRKLAYGRACLDAAKLPPGDVPAATRETLMAGMREFGITPTDVASDVQHAKRYASAASECSRLEEEVAQMAPESETIATVERLMQEKQTLATTLDAKINAAKAEHDLNLFKRKSLQGARSIRSQIVFDAPRLGLLGVT
jgi:hypothetical protein